jgi:hypothetical protein
MGSHLNNNVPNGRSVRWSDCVGQDRDICHVGTLSTSYKTSNTQFNPVTHCCLRMSLSCRMYPAGKVDISRYLAISGFPQSDHTIGKPKTNAGSLCSKSIAGLLTSSHPQMSASHLLGLQGPQQTPANCFL